jgi:hypothetical protein
MVFAEGQGDFGERQPGVQPARVILALGWPVPMLL